MQNEYKDRVEHLKYLSDKNEIERMEQEIFNNFVRQLKTFDIANPIPKLGNMRFTAIIG